MYHKKIIHWNSGIMAHAYNSSTQEAEAVWSRVQAWIEKQFAWGPFFKKQKKSNLKNSMYTVSVQYNDSFVWWFGFRFGKCIHACNQHHKPSHKAPFGLFLVRRWTSPSLLCLLFQLLPFLEMPHRWTSVIFSSPGMLTRRHAVLDAEWCPLWGPGTVCLSIFQLNEGALIVCSGLLWTTMWCLFSSVFVSICLERWGGGIQGQLHEMPL